MSADRKTQVSKCARRVRGQWLLLFSCQVVFLLALTPWARAQSQSESQCPPISPTCGDGIVSMLDGEQCDDGNTRSNDGCNATCLLSRALALTKFRLFCIMLFGICFLGPTY